MDRGGFITFPATPHTDSAKICVSYSMYILVLWEGIYVNFTLLTPVFLFLDDKNEVHKLFLKICGNSNILSSVLMLTSITCLISISNID